MTDIERRLNGHTRRKDDPPHTLLKWWPVIAAVWTAFTLLFAYLGFGLKTPSESVRELTGEIRQNRAATLAVEDTLRQRSNTHDQNQVRILDILEIFSLDMCIRRATDPYVYRRLKCRDLLKENGNASP